MSDQEPVGKRMLDQLRDHTEPYRPDAWEHFEQFRAAKNQRRRIVFYWLAAAAVITIFGTAVLTSHFIHRGNVTKHQVAKEQVKAGRGPRVVESDLMTSADTLSRTALTPSPKQVTRPSSRHYVTTRPSNLHAGIQSHLTENISIAADSNFSYNESAPQLLLPQPFDKLIVHFSILRIPPAEQREDITPRPTRSARWGVSVTQQSNQAAHSDLELNPGIGGDLLVPLSDKFSLVTGLSASKQSLNVQKPQQLVASQGAAQLQRVRYQWYNMELPLHVHYRLKGFKKLGLDAVAGISLQNSVGQEADYLYKTRRTINTYLEGSGGPVLVSTQTIEESTSVKENDHKGQWTLSTPLYLGLGLGYQWHGNTLQVEPYVKYPLGATTAEHLQLTSVGIQLRLTGAFRKRAGQMRDPH